MSMPVPEGEETTNRGARRLSGVPGAVLGFLMLAGALALILDWWVGTVERTADAQRIAIPGQGLVTLDSGDYVISHEYPGAVPQEPRELVDIELRAPDRSLVEVDRVTDTKGYKRAGHQGFDIYEFTADEPGDYLLSAGGERSVLAVSPDAGPGWGMWRLIPAMLLFGLGGNLALHSLRRPIG